MAAYPIERHTLLRRSFIHLKGVGPRSERHLWQQGITGWEELLDAAPTLYKSRRLDDVQRSLEASLLAWQRRDLYFFHQAFPGNERWRLIPGGFADIAYFDIEASGGGMPPQAKSTAVAFYFRGEVLQEHEYERKYALIERMLADAAMICTYNGAGYDVPFLSAEYGIRFPIAHVDLCPWLRRLGLRGGLKAIQKALPHLHQRDSMDIDGYDAIHLWRMHQQRVPGALETLLTYNAEDAIILEPLLVDAFNREVSARPELALEQLVGAAVPELKTKVDVSVYERLRALPRPDRPWERRAAEPSAGPASI